MSVSTPRRAARAPRRRQLDLGSASLVWSHRRLLLKVTRSQLASRYAGSVLGLAWVLLAPGLILAVYGTIYLAVFKVAAPGLSGAEYVVFIFCGLVPFLMTSEALSIGVGSVIANKSVLANTVFPIDLTPVVSVLTAQGPMAIGIVCIFVGGAAVGTLSWTAVLFPVILALHLLAVLGVVWWLSLLNVLVRDLQTLLTAVLMIMLVASPIAFTPEQVPDAVQPLIVLNPFAYFVIAYQRVLVLGEMPSPLLWGALVGTAAILFFSGSWFFSRAKRAILDYV